MEIIRSPRNITGDITINNGDIVLTDPNAGIVMDNNTGDSIKVTIGNDEGVNTVKIEEV